MTKKVLISTGLAFLIFAVVFSCKSVDIRTPEVKNNFNQ